MPLEDLTPQLRTRLSRLERLVGLFVTVAAVLLLAGLGYYVNHLAQRKGWFLKKVPYFTFVRNAAGLKVGDPVRLMGFEAGRIIEITPMPPEETNYNVYVRFQVREPHFGYLWEDSRAKVASADFLGNRYIEVTKGTNGSPTFPIHDLRELSLDEAERYAGSNNVVFAEDIYDATKINLLVRAFEPLTKTALEKLRNLEINAIQMIDRNGPTGPPKWIWNDKTGKYQPFGKDDKGYFLPVDESPALGERLETVVNAVEKALPNFLALTNQLTQALVNANRLATHADDLLFDARPIVTNLAQITANLRGPNGSLGDWLIPTNINQQLQQTLRSATVMLTNANAAVTNTDERLAVLAGSLTLTLDNLANLTSNLNAQVQVNSNLVSSISRAIIHSDELMQGLKRHWLLRSAFKEKQTNQPPPRARERAKSPKDAGGR